MSREIEITLLYEGYDDTHTYYREPYIDNSYTGEHGVPARLSIPRGRGFFPIIGESITIKVNVQ